MAASPHTGILFQNEAVIFLVSSALIVPVCQRLNISPILGFLAVGALVGPSGLALTGNVEAVQAFAELGVVFLLFMIGLELSFERLYAMRRMVFGLGGVQVGASAVVIAAVAYAWGNALPASIVLGLALALSSTAMVLQLLVERGQINQRHGRTSFSVLLFQDLAVVPVLMLINVLNAGETDEIAANLGIALAKAAIAVAVIIVAGRLVIHRLFRVVAATRSPETFVAMTLLTILAIAWATEQAGLSMALGAFLAGLLLSDTEYRHQIESDIEPFKGLLLGLFFLSVGMSLDFRQVADMAVWLAISVFGLIAVKAAIMFFAALAFGVARDVAMRSALMLAAGGEFAFVLLGVAMQPGTLVTEEVGQFMIITASLSMVLTPLLAMAGDRLAPMVATRHVGVDPDPSFTGDLEGHVIIAGYGRVGRMLSDLLTQESVPYVALDLDAGQVAQFRRQGLPVFFGDASHGDVLERVGVDRAAVVVLTLDDPEDARKAVMAVRHAGSDIPIVARAADQSHADELLALGANHVVPELLEASLQMAGLVLRDLGRSADTVSRLMERVHAGRYGRVGDTPSTPSTPS